MDMMACFLSVTPTDLAEMLKDSSILTRRTADDPAAHTHDYLGIAKYWEAIFYILTGYAVDETENARHPLWWALFDGQVLDEEQDLGHGPAHYLTNEAVMRLNYELSGVTREDVQRLYDAGELDTAGIYPPIWDHPDSLEHVLNNFDLMKNFYRAAGDAGNVVIRFFR